MFRPRIIPCLLLQNKGLVKTVNFKKPKYIGDPMNAVRIFNAKEADELIFLDINASKEKRTISLDLVKKIGKEAYMPFAVGGGINNISQMRKILKAGAEKIILNTAAVKNPQLIKEASEEFGSSTIVVSIDIKKTLFKGNRVFIFGGGKKTNHTPEEFALIAEKNGAGDIMINSVDRDGLMDGYDVELMKSITQKVRIPVVACGGAGNLKDLKEVYYKGHVSAVAAGSLFVFQGARKAVLINYPERRKIREIFEI